MTELGKSLRVKSIRASCLIELRRETFLNSVKQGCQALTSRMQRSGSEVLMKWTARSKL